MSQSLHRPLAWKWTSHVFCVSPDDLTSVSPIMRSVSKSVCRHPFPVSANVRQKRPLIARWAVHHCTPLHILALLGVADLATRWGYTRQGVHQLAARPGFPAPVAAVNGGRIRVWLLADIKAYEQGRPELSDQVAKRNKQRGYHLTRPKGV